MKRDSSICDFLRILQMFSLILFKIGFLKNCALITRKYLWWSLFLINLGAWIIESYWNSLVCLFGLILGIIPKAIWNCIIAFLDPLNRKTSRIQRTLSTRKNWFAHINWMNGKKSEAVVRRCSVKNVFLKIS